MKFVRDFSGNDRHGYYPSLNNEPTRNGATPEGEIAFEMTGVSRDYYAAAILSDAEYSAMGWEVGVRGMTINFWLNLTFGINNNPSATANYPIFWYGDLAARSSTAPPSDLYLRGSGQDNLLLAGPDSQGATVVLATGWHQYSAVVDVAAGPGPLRLYRDGVLLSTSAGNVTSNPAPATFGQPGFSWGLNDGFLQRSHTFGTLTEFGPVSVYPTALTAAQLLTLHGVMTA